MDKLSSNPVDGAILVCGDKDWDLAATLGDLGQGRKEKLISDEYGQSGELHYSGRISFSYSNCQRELNPECYISKHFSVMIPSEKLKSGLEGGLCTNFNADGKT